MLLRLILLFCLSVSICLADSGIYIASDNVANCTKELYEKCVNGHQIECWTEHNGDNYHLYTSIWDGIHFITKDLNQGATKLVDYDFTINAAGQAAVVWLESTYPDCVMKCSIWNGSEWTTQQLGDEIEYSENLKIEENGDGKILIVWVDFEEDRDYTPAIEAVYWDGSIWTSVQYLDSEHLNYVYQLQSSIDENGIGHISWLVQDSVTKLDQLKLARWDGGVLDPSSPLDIKQ
jgi:hypothetical protein